MGSGPESSPSFTVLDHRKPTGRTAGDRGFITTKVLCTSKAHRGFTHNEENDKRRKSTGSELLPPASSEISRRGVGRFRAAYALLLAEYCDRSYRLHGWCSPVRPIMSLDRGSSAVIRRAFSHPASLVPTLNSTSHFNVESLAAQPHTLPALRRQVPEDPSPESDEAPTA